MRPSNHEGAPSDRFRRACTGFGGDAAAIWRDQQRQISRIELMRTIKDVFVSPDMPILGALQHTQKGVAQSVLVVDDGRRLIATVTDCDVRRGILNPIVLR